MIIMKERPAHLFDSIRLAREAQGLSQRALGDRAGVPQASISKVESGAVDPQVSTLTALARAMGLELMLVPRHAVPAVQSLLRTIGTGAPSRESADTRIELDAMRRHLTGLAQSGPGAEDVARLAQALWALGHFPISAVQMDAAHLAHRAALALGRSRRADKSALLADLRDAVAGVVAIRDEWVRGGGGVEGGQGVRPAYSLDDEDGDG